MLEHFSSHGSVHCLHFWHLKFAEVSEARKASTGQYRSHIMDKRDIKFLGTKGYLAGSGEIRKLLPRKCQPTLPPSSEARENNLN
jgi:hypothetical protein